MSTKNTLKIIFNIAGRISYVHRYLKLLENYQINFDILIINDLNSEILASPIGKIDTNFIIKQANIKITGINSIFRIMYIHRDIILNYKYVCFVEDDNFVFPNAIDQCVEYLNTNKKYVGCNGLSFLFNKNNNRFVFLNKYSSPAFKSNNIIERAKQYKDNGGIIYYSVIRSNIFINISKEIKYIKDNNLSEIFFNYLILINGNLKTINQIYLAREYPRPLIYNIPNLSEWIKNNKLVYDINMVVLRLLKNIKLHEGNFNFSFNLFLKLTIFFYLSNRINPLFAGSRNIFFKKLINKLSNIHYKRKFEIRRFLDKINLDKINKN